MVVLDRCLSSHPHPPKLKEVPKILPQCSGILSVSSQRALEISSVIGQPPSLVRDHFSWPRLVANPCKWDEWHRPLSQSLQKLKVVSPVLKKFKHQCQNQTVLVAIDNATVVACIKKQGGTHSVEMCALLWKIRTWCNHYQITLRDKPIPGCLNMTFCPGLICGI